jgi:hypothetical protein
MVLALADFSVVDDMSPLARGGGVCLQTAFLNKVRPDRRNVRLGIAKCVF